MAILFFSLSECVKQEFKKIRCPVLVSNELKLWICLIILNIFLEFSPAFQNTEAAFKRCSTKILVQQIMMKYSSSVPVVKRRKALHANLLKIALHHRNFSKNLTTSLSQQYWKIHHGFFWGQIFFNSIPEWLLLKGSSKCRGWSRKTIWAAVAAQIYF